MKLLSWTLGCFLLCLSALVGLFEIYSFMARDAWQFLTSDLVWQNLNGAPRTIADSLALTFEGQAWISSLNELAIEPLAGFALLPILAGLGLILVWLGRYREPDFF